jgi:hypothetical protein
MQSSQGFGLVTDSVGQLYGLIRLDANFAPTWHSWYGWAVGVAGGLCSAIDQRRSENAFDD